MTSLEKAILSTLIYYDLLDKPLTALELYKYLSATDERLSFFELKRRLAGSSTIKSAVQKKNGFYFLKGREKLLDCRETRLKLAQIKWKKLKKLVKFLSLSPFIRLIAATGSLTAYNTEENSDFDLLIITAKNRLWTTRALITLLAAMSGRRRHGNLTKDRICLNCYLDENNLELSPESKPRDFHCAQEYGRLTPLLETRPAVFKKFIDENRWLKEYLRAFPWPADASSKKISSSRVTDWLQQIEEWPLLGKIGDRLEKTLGKWQTRRIQKKLKLEPSDQIFVSSQCLMLHPRSKGFELMRCFKEKFAKIENKIQKYSVW